MENASNFKGYDSVFAQRLRKLMNTGIDGKKLTQQDLAEKTGYTRQAISQYMDGSVMPNIEKLYIIATVFNVSSDYLIGISPCKSPEIEPKAICDKTGLSLEAVDVIMKFRQTGLNTALDYILINDLSNEILIEMEEYCSKLIDIEQTSQSYEELLGTCQQEYEEYQEKCMETVRKRIEDGRVISLRKTAVSCCAEFLELANNSKNCDTFMRIIKLTSNLEQDRREADYLLFEIQKLMIQLVEEYGKMHKQEE